MTVDPVLAKELKKVDLRYVNDSMPGISRRKNHDSFWYFDSDNKRITNETILKRIHDLAIPPAWQDVWICASPSGYLQSTGQDAQKRKQYIYHPDWIQLSQENKFNKIISFGDALPIIRQKIAHDMNLEELERDKIIAAVIWLLEHTLIRIGNNEYAEENNSFGLTTLRNRHVKVHGKNIQFEFRGKSGVEHSVSISNPKIAKIIKECAELPGYEIFQYKDDSDNRHTVDSSDVNEYLQLVTNDDLTAKDFRTWGGTVLCASTLHLFGIAENREDAKKKITLAVKKVSQHLRNTASVCRSYYIHPTVFSTYEKNILVPHFELSYKKYDGKKEKLTRQEHATMSLIRKYP